MDVNRKQDWLLLSHLLQGMRSKEELPVADGLLYLSQNVNHYLHVSQRDTCMIFFATHLQCYNNERYMMQSENSHG